MDAKVRVAVSPEQLRVGQLHLLGDDHHYLGHVRRLAVGDRITVFDGQGTQAIAKIVAMSHDTTTVEISERVSAPKPRFILHMAPAMIKGERMEWAISKMVELGVTSISPLVTERTIVRLKPERAKSKLQRYVSLVMAAAKQSRNSHPPQIQGIGKLPGFLQALPQVAPDELRLIPCTTMGVEEPADLRNVLQQRDAVHSATVLIGPEGGFSASEIALAVAAGFVPVSLGATILRAETACLHVAGVLRYHFG